MTALITTCRICGTEFEPDAEAIRAGCWRLCRTCRPTPAETRCERCGRVLRAGNRAVCFACLTGEGGL
jgi:hypothetical protein